MHPLQEERKGGENMDKIGGMNFGKALFWLKGGFKLRRRGWNGKEQFIYYVPEGAYPPCSEAGETLVNEKGLVEYRDYIAIKTVQGTVVPWVASQTDLLAEDWEIVS